MILVLNMYMVWWHGGRPRGGGRRSILNIYNRKGERRPPHPRVLRRVGAFPSLVLVHAALFVGIPDLLATSLGADGDDSSSILPPPLTRTNVRARSVVAIVVYTGVWHHSPRADPTTANAARQRSRSVGKKKRRPIRRTARREIRGEMHDERTPSFEPCVLVHEEPDDERRREDSVRGDARE